MKAVDACKVCRRATVHVQDHYADRHARRWWRCACGAQKLLLSAAAVSS